MTVLLFAVAAIAVVYGVWVLLVWRLQERIVFQPPAYAAAEHVAAQRVAYTSADGVPLAGYVVGTCSPHTSAVVAFHGNADVAQWLVPWAHALSRRTGACVFLAEYRGYGGLSGQPTYTASKLDADAALAFVHDRLGVPASRTVYFGHSLGTAIATELASRHPPRALVLQSPFSSARAMAARLFLPTVATTFWNQISRVRFDTEARVRTLRVPVWVAHGDRDVIIPIRMGEDVFDAAAVRGGLLVVPGAGHNDIAEVGGESYWRWISAAVTATPGALSSRESSGTLSEP